MSILCCHPNIIINKSHHVNKVYRDFKSWRIILRGQESLVVPPPRKAYIKTDELDECYYLNIKSGEMIPLYLEVPCNKCIICRDKKTRDWATRITCESNYHYHCPWWITLTYNDFNLPDCGINKPDLQKFLKRLRERLCRQLCDDIKIRFVAVGEYGGNTGRAHYHLQLFGLPSLTPKEVLSVIESSWSKRVSYKRFYELVSKLGDKAKDYTIVRNDVNNKPMYYERIGFAYVKPAHDNTPLYLAKYMFKPEINTPNGKNPNFCLSSRRNGIGYQYIVEYAEYHRSNPEITKIEFCNKHTSKVCSFGIPQYFKDYWFPTPSKIIPDDVRKSYDKVVSLYGRILSIKRELLSNHVDDVNDDIDIFIDKLNEKYFFYRPICRHYENIDDIRCANDINSLYEWHEILTEEYIHTYKEITVEYDFMMLLEFDYDEMVKCLSLRDRYKGAITQQMLSRPQKSVEDMVYDLQKRYEKLKSKDKF